MRKKRVRPESGPPCFSCLPQAGLPKQIRKLFLPSLLPALGVVFQSGCQTTPPQPFLYPSENSTRIRLPCRSVYDSPQTRHQTWEKVPPSLLFVSEDSVKVYFQNDRSRTFPRDPDLNLPPGKYRCPD